MSDDLTAPPNVLLSGIVGSVAYGLDTGDSDVDRLGVFAAPTKKLLGLHPVQQSVVSCKPDATFHEAGKFAALALKVNPTITELLWLPDDLYETRTELGEGLIKIRSAFLSRTATRNAYLGYITQQLKRMERAGEDMHPVPHGEACSRVWSQQPVRGRIAPEVPRVRERAGEGELLAQAGGVPGSQAGAQSGHAIRSAGEPGAAPSPELRADPGGFRHVPPSPGGHLQDLRRAGNGGGSRPSDGRVSRDSVPALQPGPGSLQGRPDNAPEGDRLPARMRPDGSRCKRCRVEKHARHLYRLHAQGIMLWQTGRLTVRLPHGDAVLCRAFGEKVAAGDLEAGRKVIEWAEHIFDTSRTPLPERPDERPVEEWLQDVRREHYATVLR